MKTWRNDIGGQWRDRGEWAEVADPFTGEPAARYALASAADVDEALAHARGIAPELARLPGHRRATALRAIADGVRARSEAFVDAIVAEGGKPVTYARGEVARAVTTFALAAEEATRIGGELLPIDIEARADGFSCFIARRPVGVVGGIAPFNFPLNLVAHKVAPALAAGNAIVMKPALETPGASALLAEVVRESGLPAGALQVVHARNADAERLVTSEHVDFLSFTGSANVGWALRAKAGRKKVALELGGNAAMIVHADADVQLALDRAYVGAFAHAGQVCISVQRLLVHRAVYDEVRAGLVARAKSAPTGDPRDAKTVVGPMIRLRDVARVAEWVDEARAYGANVLCGGEAAGRFYPATVIEDTPRQSRVYAEEVFGPVVTLEVYDEFDDALARVEDSRFGLQAGVFTYDWRRIRAAWERLHMGAVIVNEAPTFRVDNFPYGGIKDSGLGREGVRWAIEEMTEPRALVLGAR